MALEDALHFGQRPKLDDYGAYVFLVFYGAREHGPRDAAPLLEVQMFISGHYLVTLHQDPLPALDEQRERLDGLVLHSEQFLIYRVFDALTDSFFPLLARIDEQIDELEAAILGGPTDEQLQRLFALRRELVAMRKVVSPQRDLFARGIDQIADLPGLMLDERDYFRDVYDHLILISDLIDSYRDLLSGATDLYLSTISNRQNEVMKQLAIVGSIFLPLSFITGFFGQNFRWLGGNRDLIDMVVLRAWHRQHRRHVRLPAGGLQAQGLDVTIATRSPLRAWARASVEPQSVPYVAIAFASICSILRGALPVLELPRVMVASGAVGPGIGARRGRCRWCRSADLPDVRLHSRGTGEPRPPAPQRNAGYLNPGFPPS